MIHCEPWALRHVLVALTVLGAVSWTELACAEEPEGAQTTERDCWAGQITLGATSAYGTARSRTLVGSANVARQGRRIRLSLEGTTAYAWQRGEENTKAHRGAFQFDYAVLGAVFVTPLVTSLEYDKVQNISLRWRIGAGVGYHVLRAPDDAAWSIEVGYGLVRTRFRRVPADGDRYTNGRALRVATRLAADLTEWIVFTALYEAHVGLNDIRETTHHAVGSLSFAVVADFLSLNVTMIYDRVEQPQRDAAGRKPRRDGAKVILGLGLVF